MPEPTIAHLAEDLRAGRTTSRRLVDAALERIADPAGEGRRAFTVVYAEAARAHADATDRLRAHGIELSPLMGLPISIKDLFDVAGETTTAASRVLADAAPATRDAAIVTRLRAAGAVIVGKTNMTEFAFSAIGTNDAYGTPRNPFDRATGRIPGGSSSGAAVGVTDGMAVAAIGTDTGGSIRIPAALCGIVGFKPTAHRVPTEGAVPLSTTLDSIGPLARSVACCALIDAALSGTAYAVPEPLPLARLRFVVPTNYLADDVEPAVAAAFDAALERLARAGARVERARIEAFDMLPAMLAKGGFAGAESAWWHAPLIATRRERYDRRILGRILFGAEQRATDYLELLGARRAFVARYAEALDGYDAVLAPTTPVVAPPLSAVADDAGYARYNDLLLRNPRSVNFLDGCALSLPVHPPGTAPVGLMAVGRRDEDARLLRIGRTLEAALASS